MAGHSKWSKVKHTKGLLDVKRGAKISRVETANDSNCRTAADIFGLSAKHPCFLTAPGSVSYMFHEKGQSAASHTAGVTAERLLEPPPDAGTADIAAAENYFILTSPPDRFHAVGEALRAGVIAPGTQRLTFVPDPKAPTADEVPAGRVLRLHGALEDSDGAQNVHSNFEIARRRRQG